MSKIIGLVGFARVGKDTAATNMPCFMRIAFADALKKDLAPLFEKIGLNLFKDAHKELARKLMVDYGEIARELDGQYWIKRIETKLDDAITKGTNIVFTDVRYLNEARYILDCGGKLINIVRPCQCCSCGGDMVPANDTEEASIGEILNFYSPKIVRNDGTPKELGRKILA